MTPDPAWPPFPLLGLPPDTPQTLADALALWANDTLAHQAACLALAGNGGLHLTPLPACHEWVERICKALVAGVRDPLPGGERPVLLLGVQDLVDCPDDLLPSLARLQELDTLDRLGGVRLALPGMVATRIAMYRGRGGLADSQDQPAQSANAFSGERTLGEETPLLPKARGTGGTDRCVVS